jgi:hypothetical protein
LETVLEDVICKHGDEKDEMIMKVEKQAACAPLHWPSDTLVSSFDVAMLCNHAISLHNCRQADTASVQSSL